MIDDVLVYCTAYLAVGSVAFALLGVASERYPAPSRKGPTTVSDTPAFTAADDRAFAQLLSGGTPLQRMLQPPRAERPDPPTPEPEPDEDGDDDGTHVHVCVRCPDGSTIEASAWLPNPTSSAEAAEAVRRCSAGVLAQLAPAAST